MIAFALGVFILCSIIPPRATGQTSDDQIAQHFRTGQEAMRQGQFARATEEFKKVLGLDPTLVEAEVNLGLAYHSSFEYELAVRYLSKALQQRPDLPGANVIAGIDYLKLGFPEKSLPYLQRALKADPSNREARQALASVYLAQENFRGAAEEFRKTAGLESDKSEAWFKLGHQYLDLAARLAYRAARLYRESAWGHRFLGDLLFQRSRWEEAVQEYRKALAIEPRQPGLHTSVGQAYLRGGKPEQAEAEFHLELQLDAANEGAWLGMAEAQLTDRKPTDALESIRKAWDISPEVVALQREFPGVEIPHDAAREFAARLQSSPEGAAKHFLLAVTSLAGGDNSTADQQWNALHNDLLAWQKRTRGMEGQRACRSHDYSVCADFLEAQKVLSDSQRLLLGKTQFALRHYERASDVLAQVRGMTKQNAEASYWLSRTYQALGTEAYARLEESFPDSWRAHQLRAEGYALRQENENAVKEFRMALRMSPDNPELHEALGELYLATHSDADAQRELESALAADPSRAHALCLLGRLHVQHHEDEQSLPYLKRAIALQPDLAEASSLLGTAYVRLGRFADAVPRLQKAAALDHYGNIHYQLYVAYQKLGQGDLAHKALARSQELRRGSLERDQALIMGGSEPESDPQ